MRSRTIHTLPHFLGPDIVSLFGNGLFSVSFFVDYYMQ